MNIDKDLKIDKYNIDKELVQQPQTYYEWAKTWIAAISEREHILNKYDILKANIEKKIRRNPDEYGIENIKESAIKASVLTHPKVKKMHKKYLAALYNERILEEAKKSMQQKKNMLESLTQLNIQLHFAEPKVYSNQAEKTRKTHRKNISKQIKITRRTS